MNYIKIRERERANNRVYFFLDISWNEHRRQEATGLFYERNSKNKREIRNKVEEKRLSRLRELESGYLGSSKFDIDLIQYFEDHNKSKGYNNTNNPYECSLKKLKLFVARNPTKTTFDRLENNSKFFQQFADFLISELGSQNSAWTYFAKLKAILNNAVRERLIIHSPAKDIKIKWKDVEKTYLTIQELQLLSQTKCNYDLIKYAFLFSCFTGIRFSDIKKLQWKDIKKDSNGITTLHFRQKKTGSVEYFPLNSTAVNLMYTAFENQNAIPKPEALIFPLPYIAKIERALKSWVKKAEINKHITFHSGRHTYAVNSLTNGVDIFTVSKLLGHRDLKTTMVYAKVVDAKLVEAVNKLPTILN